MNFGEIVTEVRIVLKDQRADVVASIPDYINEAYQWIAAESELPALKTVFVVSTVLDQAYVNMPTSFDGRLKYCGTTDGELNILNGGIAEMLEKYSDLTAEGDIIDVAVEGSVLWYACIPAEVTSLTCLGYAIPATLTQNADTPSALPDYLHRDLLVNKAAAIGYSIIEDGLETEKPNTNYYEGMTAVGKLKLDLWIEKRRGHLKRSIWSN